MASIKVMLNTDRKSVSELYPLVIRVIHKRQKKLIYTPYKIKIEEFDCEKQIVISNANTHLSPREITAINRYTAGQRRQLSQIIIKLERQLHNDFSVNDILSKYGRNIVERNVFRFIENDIESKTRVQNFGMATLYRTTCQSLRRFTAGREITFNDITYKFITNYIAHLQERGLERNTINMYLRNLRSIYNKARKEGIISAKVSPFNDVKMNVTETVKRSLSKDAIRTIAHVDLSASRTLSQARDVFMFSFYTRGMSLVDMLYLKRSDISGGIIYYIRNKTKQNIQITITQPLQCLIDKYCSDSIYILPFLNNAEPDVTYCQYRRAVWNINKHLKRLGRLLGIEIPLTTYVARHSWATIAKNEGGSIATISEGLGHTSEKTTQIYLRVFDRSIIDALNDRVVSL